MTTRRRRARGELRKFRRDLVALLRDPLTCVEAAPLPGTTSATRTTKTKEQHA